MSNIHDDTVARIRKNFKRIIALYGEKKEETRVLQEENRELKKRLAALEEEVNGLKDKQESTALTSAFVNASGASHDAKIQVNRIVREIDKCIALLNK